MGLRRQSPRCILLQFISKPGAGVSNKSLVKCAEVVYNGGFNNISNFNRLFKKKKGCTPKEFRENYSDGSRVFVWPFY